MKLVFVSNYFNHHQKAFCEELYKRLGSDFSFVSTSEMREERKKLGYSQNDIPDYVIKAHADAKKLKQAVEVINSADVVIAGAAPEEMLSERLRSKKIIIRYAERPFKKAPSVSGRIYHSIRFKRRDLGNPNVYMLCAGAYAANDFAGLGVYKNRMYKWGYFPDVREYDTDALFAEKKNKTILWCGRFLDWKHPDDALEVAKRLKADGYDYHMNIIGAGVMEDELKQLAEKNSLTDYVDFPGSMSPDRVRSYMEQAGIFLFTSDRQEGWGAVLNEAMNSGCAVVASHETGSATYLVNNKINGLVYQSGCVDDLYEKTKNLLDKPYLQRSLGENAYHTITGMWNAAAASSNLMKLIEKIQNKDNVLPFTEGPCSIAGVIQEDWFID